MSGCRSRWRGRSDFGGRAFEAQTAHGDGDNCRIESSTFDRIDDNDNGSRKFKRDVKLKGVYGV